MIVETIDSLIKISKSRGIEPKVLKLDLTTYKDFVLELRRFHGLTTYDIEKYKDIPIVTDKDSWTTSISIQVE